MVDSLAYCPRQVVLYGQSIGSGPSMFLSSNPDTPVSGLILHSPIASCIKIVAFNSKGCGKSDVFPNSSLAAFVSCPVLIMHGDKDKMVPQKHSQLIMDNLPGRYKTLWSVEGAGHNNIYSHASSELYQ